MEKNSRSILAVLPSSKRWWRYDRNLTRRSRGIILDAWDPIVRPHAAFSYLLAAAKAQRLHPDFPSTARTAEPGRLVACGSGDKRALSRP